MVGEPGTRPPVAPRPLGPTALRLASGASLVVGGVASVVLVVGWWGGVDIVTRLMPNLVSMKANTAVGFILLAAALNPRLRARRRIVSDVAAVVLTLLGAATITEYLLGVDLRIDELLAQDTKLIGTPYPGRPGLNTAIGFAAMGPSLLLVDRRMPAALRIVGQALAALVGLLALLALLGYALSVTTVVGLGSATQMALHTSVLFVLGAVGAGAVASDVGLLGVLSSDLEAGRSARMLLPILVGAQLVAVGSVESLAWIGLLDDVGLQLAFTATAGVAVVSAGTLVVMRRLVQVESDSERLSRDIETLRAAFPDVHLRLGADDVVEMIHGDPARHRLGRGPEGIVAGESTLLDVAPVGAGNVLLEGLARARHLGRMAEVTYRPGGSVGGAYEARFVPFDDGSVAVSVRDASELAHAQQELRALADRLEDEVAERTAELERSNTELERFAYLASHDLQEPLRMVTGFVTRIAERYGDQLDERGKQYVHFAVDGADRMSRLIEGLLAYSRAGRVDPERIVPTRLATIVEEVLATLAGAVEDAGATVHAGALDHVVLADPTLLRQVVQNLVANAMKFTRSDVAPTVSLWAEPSTLADGHVPAVALHVQDNGIGIAPEHRQEVFAMFRRVSTDPAHRGTGIGLTLVQQMVEAHGGTITVGDAEPGPGTRFVVTLPTTRQDMP